MKKLLLLLLLITSIDFAQELEARVFVNYEQLQTQYKDKLVDFKNVIEDYLNTTKFTENIWEWEKIKCSFNIFFTGGSGETKYSTQIVVTSQRPIEGSKASVLMLSILDNSWSFRYEQGQSMFFSPNEFDPLKSFLDFYAYLILGFDADSYGPDPLQGNQYFENAFNILTLGQSSNYSGQWSLESSSYNKASLLNDITSAKFHQLRQDYMDYHFNGIDLMATDKENARKGIIKLIDHLYEKIDQLNPRSVFLKVLFDAKSGEIIKYLKDFKDPSIFVKLKKVDPAHTSKYNEIIEELN